MDRGSATILKCLCLDGGDLRRKACAAASCQHCGKAQAIYQWEIQFHCGSGGYIGGEFYSQVVLRPPEPLALGCGGRGCSVGDCEFFAGVYESAVTYLFGDFVHVTVFDSQFVCRQNACHV